MTNITFSQVQKSFHKKLVLDIPDFQADSGEIFSIVGGNGAGKSTFIKLLAGIFLQDKGEVRVHGVSNRSKKIHSLVKFVLESGQGLYSYLTAMENLQYFLGLNGIALSHIKQRWISCVTSWRLPLIRTRWFQNCPRATVRN